jgi:hypothetical protein
MWFYSFVCSGIASRILRFVLNQQLSGQFGPVFKMAVKSSATSHKPATVHYFSGPGPDWLLDSPDI